MALKCFHVTSEKVIEEKIYELMNCMYHVSLFGIPAKEHAVWPSPLLVRRIELLSYTQRNSCTQYNSKTKVMQIFLN